MDRERDRGHRDGERGREDWQPFIGRVLAYVCVHLAELDAKPLVERADFLTKLGLPRREAAVVLGSSDDSLRVMQSRAQKPTRTGSGK